MRGEMLSTVTYYPEPALVRLPGVHSLIQMHVPDQTGRRSLHLHCSLDLNRNVPTLIGCKQDSNLGGANSPRVFIPLNGAQRHRDRQDCLPHSEMQLADEFEYTRITGAGDGVKGRAAEAAIGIAERRCVGHVKGLGAELEIQTLAHTKCLADHEVGVLQAGAANWIGAPRGAE